MAMSSSNLSIGSEDTEVPITMDTKEDVWVMIGGGMGMVMWVVEGKMLWTTGTSMVGEKSGVEVSEDKMLIVENGEEGIKIFSGLDDDDKVTKGMCRGIFKNGSFVVVGCNIAVCIEEDVIDTYEEVKASYSWDNVGDGATPVGKVEKVWIDERSKAEDKEL